MQTCATKFRSEGTVAHRAKSVYLTAIRDRSGPPAAYTSACCIGMCGLTGPSADAILWVVGRRSSASPWEQDQNVAMHGFQHRSGRATAFIYLAIGLALLLYVFWQSHGMLTHPVPGLALPHRMSPSQAAPPVDFGSMGAAALKFVLKLLVLLVMTVVASLVTARGVHLYYVASTPAGRGNESSDDPAPALSMSQSATSEPPPPSKAAGRQ